MKNQELNRAYLDEVLGRPSTDEEFEKAELCYFCLPVSPEVFCEMFAPVIDNPVAIDGFIQIGLKYDEIFDRCETFRKKILYIEKYGA